MSLLLFALFSLQAAPPDSQAALRTARDAQAAFERFRRSHLPLTAEAGGYAAERIGRFRFWHDDGTPRPPAEPTSIRDARRALLRTLDAAGSAHPHSTWLSGQRVRYWLEQGVPRAALAAALACVTPLAWCQALEGLARHMDGDFPGAEAAFDSALAIMPEADRCRWTDASLLLQGRVRDRYRKLGCDARATVDRTLWWLSHPLFLLPANDRRTEHLARVTMTEIMRDARNAYGLRWDRDLSEMTVRYGWITAWSAEWSRPGSTSMDGPAIVGYHRSPGFHFLPPPAALEEPYATDAGAWHLSERTPREEYAPSYADTIVDFPHQAATFRRGDSALIVAVYDLSGTIAADSLEVALVLSRGPGDHAITQSREARGVLTAVAPCGGLVVGLEALDRKARRAARARYALPLPAAERVTVSDLLLLEPADTLAADLAAILASTSGSRVTPLPSTNLETRRRLVVFWETYGLHPNGEPVAISLSVRRSRDRVLDLQWQEVLHPVDQVAPRALLLDLSRARRGRYRIELRVAPSQQDPAFAAANITLR